MSKVLLPILEAGRLRVILTMDEQKFLEISAKNSTLANTLNKIMVPPANREETMKVLQDKVPMLEQKYHVVCTYWALQEAYRLSEKYIHNIEMPGRAFRYLKLPVIMPSNNLSLQNLLGVLSKTLKVSESKLLPMLKTALCFCNLKTSFISAW